MRTIQNLIDNGYAIRGVKVNFVGPQNIPFTGEVSHQEGESVYVQPNPTGVFQIGTGGLVHGPASSFVVA